MRGFEVRIVDQPLYHHDGRERRARRGFEEGNRPDMTKYAAVPGRMVGFHRSEHGGRLRTDHEAQKEQYSQSPPVVVDLTHHAGNLITLLL